MTLSQISGAIFLLGFIPYWIGIFRRKTVPSKVSWLIWGFTDWITLYSMYVERQDIFMIGGATAGATFSFLLALKYGKAGWDRIDKICLIGAVISLGFCYFIEDKALAILVSQTATFIGSFPTFELAWEEPRKTGRMTMTIFFISCVVAVIALGHPATWTVESAAQPLTFTLIAVIIVLLIWVRPLFRPFPRLH